MVVIGPASFVQTSSYLASRVMLEMHYPISSQIAYSGGKEVMGSPLCCFVVVALLFLQLLRISSSSSSSPAPPAYCGAAGVAIPYPFGVINGSQKAASQDFEVRCDGIQATLTVGGKSNLPILNISLEQGFVRVAAVEIAKHCTGGNSSDVVTHSSSWIDLEGTPFTFSNSTNRLTVIGCDALSMIQDPGGHKYRTGCVAFCDAKDGALDQSCSGIGCCQAVIPPGLQSFDLKFRSIGGLSTASGTAFNCNKAFLTEQDKFSFSAGYADDVRQVHTLTLVLEWVIAHETCAEASSRPRAETYACKNNAECYDASIGYRCRCNKGYYGNPYLPEGCQDFDECQDRGTNDCMGHCINTPGSFQCKCPSGMIGDGRRGGSGCTKTKESLLKLGIGVGVGVFCLLALVGSIFSYWVLQKRRITRLKEIFFRQNGGLLLQKQIAAERGSHQGTRIFTVEEMEKATDNFSENKILGRGGQGTVYKGILPDKRIVAIKKSRIADETQIEQFINEVIILSKIDHPNVVKLLGCCLETQVPLLVYEFVPNGTLFDLIHGEECSTVLLLTWEHRLRIAVETAGALSYLHSAASIPIIHRDVKSTNILLDENFTAKVSDFGASRSVPFDRTHVTTLVQGTLGYLDPEYFQTSQLTEKSDVYSFGVVLVELLTGQKPISCFRPGEERNLASHFIVSLRAKRLRQVLQAQILQEAGMENLGVVARLARRCLHLKGEDRPSMKEVALELEWAMRFLKRGVDRSYGM